MIYLNMFIVMIVPLILGILILSLALQKRAEFFGFWEKMALSFSAGIGLFVIMMFLMASAKIPLTLQNLLLATAFITIGSGLYLLIRKTFLFGITEIRSAFNLKELKMSAVEYILSALIIIKVSYTYFTALIKPMVDVDAFQFYSIVAKGIYYDHTFLTPYLQKFISDKPLFAYLSQGWALLGLQTVNDALIKIIYPTLFLCLITIFYYCLRRYFKRLYALIFTFFLSTFPFMVYHVSTAYADFPMTFYYATGTIYMFLFMKEHTSKSNEKAFANLIIAAFLLGFSIWVKRAGLILVLINLAVLTFYLIIHKKLISKDTLKLIVIPAVIFIIVAGPWIVYGQKGTFTRVTKGVIGIEEPVMPGQAITEQPLKPEINIIISIFLRKTFLYADWHLLLLLFLICLIFFYKRAFSPPNIFLLTLIFIDLFVIVGQFKAKEMYPSLLDGTLLDRLLMNVMPVILFFCAESILPTLEQRDSRPPVSAARASRGNKTGS